MKIKKTKFQKRLFSLLLILFLCIENFAAIVSDNDGSAFITNELSDEMIQFNFSNAKY